MPIEPWPNTIPQSAIVQTVIVVPALLGDCTLRSRGPRVHQAHFPSPAVHRDYGTIQTRTLQARRDRERCGTMPSFPQSNRSQLSGSSLSVDVNRAYRSASGRADSRLISLALVKVSSGSKSGLRISMTPRTQKELSLRAKCLNRIDVRGSYSREECCSR